MPLRLAPDGTDVLVPLQVPLVLATDSHAALVPLVLELLPAWLVAVAVQVERSNGSVGREEVVAAVLAPGSSAALAPLQLPLVLELLPAEDPICHNPS